LIQIIGLCCCLKRQVALLPFAGLWLNAFKSESVLETMMLVPHIQLELK